MDTSNHSDNPFWDRVKRANNVANRLLRSHPGGFTPEDVVGVFFEKQLKRGANQEEIEAMMSQSTFWSILSNNKNDLWRGEAACKRGSGQPAASLDTVEEYSTSVAENPEEVLIQKETAIEAMNLLNKLMHDAGLSETQVQILDLGRQGYTSDEIAATLHTDPQTVYSRRSEALRKLQKHSRRLSNR